MLYQAFFRSCGIRLCTIQLYKIESGTSKSMVIPWAVRVEIENTHLNLKAYRKKGSLIDPLKKPSTQICNFRAINLFHGNTFVLIYGATLISFKRFMD